MNIKGKLTSSVASSVWDSRKLLRSLFGSWGQWFSACGPQPAAVWPADFGTPPLAAEIPDVEASILCFRAIPWWEALLCVLGLFNMVWDLVLGTRWEKMEGKEVWSSGAQRPGKVCVLTVWYTGAAIREVRFRALTVLLWPPRPGLFRARFFQ